MEILFFIMAAIIVGSGIAVVALRNPIYSALSLVLNLITVGALFAQLEAHFLSTAQIIVYAGAIMVLVMFVLMLLNIKVENPSPRGAVLVSAAVVLGVLFLLGVIPILVRVFSVFPDGGNSVVGSVKNIGEVLYSRFVFPFEAASLLIMTAIVGAVMLASKMRRGGLASSTNGGTNSVVGK